MKLKSLFILLVFTAIPILYTGCADDSSSDSSKGFASPEDTYLYADTPDSIYYFLKKPVTSNKTYHFNDSSINEHCATSADCNAVVFDGSISGTRYFGLAVNDPASNFSLKIYFPNSIAIQEVNGNTTNVTKATTGCLECAEIILSGTNYTELLSDIDIDVTYYIHQDVSLTEGGSVTVEEEDVIYYQIDFNSPITISNGVDPDITISSSDYIVAAKYPE